MSVLQIGLLLLASFFLMLALSVPVSISLIVSSLVTVSAALPIDLSTFVACQKMVSGVDSFSLLAVPFFILTGVLMNTGGIAQRLINLAKAFVGRIPGGLAHTNIVGNTMFGALSGSAVAASIAVGGVMLPEEEAAGYDKKFAAAANIASAPTGLIIPPSGILIIYAVLSGSSVVGMIMSGYIPGILWCLACMAVAFIVAEKNKYPTSERLPASELFKYFVDAIPSILLIVIIIGGISSGIFTATEAAVVASVYGIVIGLFVHRELKLEKLWAIFRDNAAFIAGTMFVMAPSKATGQVFAYLNITKIIANFMFSISTNPYIVLCMIFVIMFIVGMFVQTTPAIVILAPTLLAVVSQVGIDPIHFGIIMTLALAIAFVTPPVALNLFVGSSMTGLSIDKIVRAFMPFLIGLIVAFFIVSFVPAISLGVLGDWSLTFG